jgi:hypothetical protein
MLFKNHNADLIPFLRQMGGYFAQFSTRPGNHYIQLVALAKRMRIRPTFVMLNYEMLLEYAIQENGLHAYGGLALEIPNNHMRVLKIHGSCHFLPDTQGRSFEAEDFQFTSPTGAIFGGGVRPARSTDEIYAFLRMQTLLAPVMAMYAKGKRVLYCPDFIKRLTALWVQSASDAKRIFIIGVAVNEEDNHVWGTLAKSQAPLYYVGPDGRAFLDWASRRHRRDAHVLADSFREALPKIGNVCSR